MGAGRSLEPSPTKFTNDVVCAVIQNDIELLQRWIECGGDVNYIDSNGYYLTMYAAYYGREEVLRELFRAGADLHNQNDEGMTAFMTASYSGHLNIIEYLLSLGANPCEFDKFGTTPLMFASYNGHTDIVRLLVSLPVDSLAKDHENLTAYDMALTQDIRNLIAPLMYYQRKSSWLTFTYMAQDLVELPLHPIALTVIHNSDLVRYLSEYL